MPANTQFRIGDKRSRCSFHVGRLRLRASGLQSAACFRCLASWRWFGADSRFASYVSEPKLSVLLKREFVERACRAIVENTCRESTGSLQGKTLEPVTMHGLSKTFGFKVEHNLCVAATSETQHPTSATESETQILNPSSMCDVRAGSLDNPKLQTRVNHHEPLT